MKNKLIAILMMLALMLPVFVVPASADNPNLAEGSKLVYEKAKGDAQPGDGEIPYVEAEDAYFLDVTDDGGQGARFVSFPIEPGYTYILQADVKGVSLIGDAELKSTFTGSTGFVADTSVYSAKTFTLSGEYQTISFPFAVADSCTNSRVHVGFYRQKRGDVYFKNIVVKKVVPEAKPNMVSADKKRLYYSGGAEVTTYDATEDAYLLQRNDKVRYTAVALTPGVPYVLEASVKYTSGDRGGKLVQSIEGGGGFSSIEQLSTEDNCYFGAEYKTWKTKFVIDPKSTSPWPHLGYQLQLNGPAYVRITVREWTPDLTVSATGLENGAKINANGGATINYAFSAKPFEMKAENVQVTPAADVQVTKVDATNYTVALSGLVSDTAYTVSLVNVQDMYTNPASSTISFTTNPAVLSDTAALSAVAKVEGDKLTLNLSADADKTVYVMAAKYEGTKMTDIKFAKATIGAEAIPVEFTGVDDNYKVFVWDTALTSLCNTKLVSELK